MSKTLLSRRQESAERQKANKFIRKYYKEHGTFPSVEAVQEAKVLTEEEAEDLSFNIELSNLVKKSEKESVAAWDYIWNEETWNDSYANGTLKDYYVWADEKGAYPYKEDLWNTVANRAANWNDIEKDGEGKPIEYEDGYHYANCVRCWQGAINAPGAAYPWCGVKIEPFEGTIKFEYDGGEAVYPWGDYKKFNRTFAIASIPTELGEDYKLDGEGKTSFDPSKLVVTAVKA